MALPFPTFLQTKSKVACALLVAGEKLEKYVNVKDILTDMGTYFQVQDDYLDCFSDPDVLGKIGTDIEDFKCSWLVVKALERANGDQKKLLHENYGKSDQACITKVKELYIQLGLEAWVIWNLCNVENKMISVERILQFSNIPSEAPLVIEGHRPNPDWPRNGTIEIDNLHVQYSPSLPMVLRGVTCTFPGKKKIGVVGRTGSGKSTLIQALFRVVEPSKGWIWIDGVDICKMGLQDLRSRLSIIPQDPTLFQGTMRTNLDPLNQHSDIDIWQVLNKCHLGEIVRQDQRLLDAPVAEDGENWSMGQRQLVCLARVLLNRRKVLVLDEATASVDTATDNLIQKTIREQTHNCTVITVAHRIPTVIDNDLVMVLDEGQVLEYDSPAELLKDYSSAFSKLVMEFLNRTSQSNHHMDPN